MSIEFFYKLYCEANKTEYLAMNNGEFDAMIDRLTARYPKGLIRIYAHIKYQESDFGKAWCPAEAHKQFSSEAKRLSDLMGEAQ